MSRAWPGGRSRQETSELGILIDAGVRVTSSNKASNPCTSSYCFCNLGQGFAPFCASIASCGRWGESRERLNV